LGGQLAALFYEQNEYGMYFRLILLLLLVMIAAPVSAGEYRPYLNVQSVTYSQPIAIKSILNEWQPPFKGGKKAMTFNKAEAGLRWRNWQMGIFERYDYLLNFSSQTAELVYRTENHLPLEIGKDYELRIKARQQASRGIRVGYRYKFTPSFIVGFAGSYLQGKSLTDGGVQGTAHVTAEKDYDFQFNADYSYSRDVLFSRDVNQPKGNGYSLDFSMDWRPSDHFSTQLSIFDLKGKIFWNDAPYSVATATSATKTYDEDGYVRYNPAISGYESNKNYTQNLPRKIFLATKYQWSESAELIAEVMDFEIIHFTSLGAGWCYFKESCIQGLYNTTAKALSMRYQGHGFRIELGSDDFNLNRARYVVMQISFNQAL
jgi:hypothetical protein